MDNKILVGFLGLNAPLVSPKEKGEALGVGSVSRGDHAICRTVISMSYAKKNKKKKKLMKKGLIKKPEETRLLDLPLPSSLDNDIAIVWFRKDLRVKDNESLHLACTAARVLPIYVFDERDFGPDNLSSFGFEKTGPFQSAFLVEAVQNLRRNLRKNGAELYIRTGRPEKIITDLCREYLASGVNVHVVAQKEVTKEETTIEFLLQRSLKRISMEKAQARLHLVWGSTLHHIQDLPYTASNFFPIAFTTFKTRLDRKKKKGIVREEIPIPTLIPPPPEPELEKGDVPSLYNDLKVHGLMEPAELEKPFPSPQACYDFHGGEDRAIWRIDDYIWKKGGLFYYQKHRQSAGTADFSTKLSPFLALGCVSPRTVYWEAMKYQEKYPRKQQQGSYQLEVQLQWRDFFRLTAVVYKNQLFARDGLGQMDKRGRLTARTFAKREPTEEQWEKIKRWMNGTTGIPYIDAGMRELNNTGYMGNRLRQNTASYLMHDLECPDWRIGAEYFQSKLIDHDVTSNWMGWQYIAGVSNDPKHGKRYPVVKQALTYDETGFFARRWCPELSLVPEPEIHVPFLLTEEEQEVYSFKLGDTYPMPAVKPWRIPSEIDRPTELPKAAPEPRQRRRPKLEEEVEELVAASEAEEAEEAAQRESETERFFVEAEEHIDDEDDFLAELLAMDDGNKNEDDPSAQLDDDEEGTVVENAVDADLDRGDDSANNTAIIDGDDDDDDDDFDRDEDLDEDFDEDFDEDLDEDEEDDEHLTTSSETDDRPKRQVADVPVKAADKTPFW